MNDFHRSAIEISVQHVDSAEGRGEMFEEIDIDCLDSVRMQLRIVHTLGNSLIRHDIFNKSDVEWLLSDIFNVLKVMRHPETMKITVHAEMRRMQEEWLRELEYRESESGHKSQSNLRRQAPPGQKTPIVVANDLDPSGAG